MFSIESVAHVAVTYLTNTLLPGAALALLAWGLLRLLKPLNATTCYVILYGAMLALIGLPFLTLPQGNEAESASIAISTPLPVTPLPAPVSPATSAASTFTGETAASAVSEQPTSQSQPSAAAMPFQGIEMRWEFPQLLLLVLFGVWVLGAGVLLLRLAWSFAHVQLLKRHAGPLPTSLEGIASSLKQGHVLRTVRILSSSRVAVPMSLGFFKPVILLPEALLHKLTESELKQILLHETAHLRRFDDWGKLVQKLVHALLFFHPAVWWLNRQLDLAREAACDDHVLVQQGGQRQAYAACLLKLSQFGFKRSLDPFQLGLTVVTHLERRMRWVLDLRRPLTGKLSKPRLGIGLATLLLGGVLFVQVLPSVAIAEPAKEIASSTKTITYTTQIAGETIELEMRFPLDQIAHFEINGDAVQVRGEGFEVSAKGQNVQFRIEQQRTLILTLEAFEGPFTVGGSGDLALLGLYTDVSARSFEAQGVQVTGELMLITMPATPQQGIVNPSGRLSVTASWDDQSQAVEIGKRILIRPRSANEPANVSLSQTETLSYASEGKTIKQQLPPCTEAAGTFLLTWGSEGSEEGQFDFSRGVAVDSQGNVYVADNFNHRIQKFSSSGDFITAWGSLGNGDGQLNGPSGVAVDSQDNAYVADELNHRIQKFTSAGAFVTAWGSLGNGDGQFNYPHDVAVDSQDNVYIVDSGNFRIQKFTSEGTFILNWGSSNSIAERINVPTGVTVDSQDNVYVADSFSQRIQKFTSDGVFIAKWGRWGSSDGQLDGPEGVAVDNEGNVYVADSGNHRIQKFTSDGTFIASWGALGIGDGTPFHGPLGVAVDDGGNVYVSDGTSIRKYCGGN